MTDISIEFGALADPIDKQLLQQGYSITEDEAKRFNRIAESIVMLHLNGIIPDSVRDNGRKKLMKMVCSAKGLTRIEK